MTVYTVTTGHTVTKVPQGSKRNQAVNPTKMKKKTEYIRKCKRCKQGYLATGKGSLYCESCKKPLQGNLGKKRINHIKNGIKYFEYK